MKNRIIIGVAIVGALSLIYVAMSVLEKGDYVNAETAPLCGMYGPSDAIDTRFGSPFNLVSGYKGSNLIVGGCSTSVSATITIGNNPLVNMVDPPPSDRNPALLIAAYKKMIVAKVVYIYSPGSTGWKLLTNITSPDNNFFNSTIDSTWDYGYIRVNAGTLAEGTHYILGYSCLSKDGAWKCGCKNPACTEQGWQIQKLIVTKPAASCPVPPDSYCGLCYERYPYSCDPDDPTGPNPCYCRYVGP